MGDRLDIASAGQELERSRTEHLYCPRNLLLLLGEDLPRLRRSIADMVQRLHVGVVINGVRSSTDADLKDVYPLVIRNYYGFDLKGMGEVIFSDFIQSSSATMVPAVTAAERGTEFAEVFDTIAGKLLSTLSKADHSQAPALAPCTYYELLGVHPGSSGQDIRAQYEKLRTVYAPQSPLMRDLFDSDNLYLYTRLLDSVYQNLMDPDIRREYDLVAGRAMQTVDQALPEGFDIREVIRKYNRQKKAGPSVVKRDVFGREAGETPVKGDSFEDREPGPIIARFGDRRLTGADLRAVREEMGVSIKMISERTRISQAVIRAIEENNPAQLPGPTYLRGFLRSYCRAIRISETDTERFIADIIGLAAAPATIDDGNQKRG